MHILINRLVNIFKDSASYFKIKSSDGNVPHFLDPWDSAVISSFGDSLHL